MFCSYVYDGIVSLLIVFTCYLYIVSALARVIPTCVCRGPRSCDEEFEQLDRIGLSIFGDQ